MRAVPIALCVAACATLLVPADAAAQAPPMRPGLWETTVQTEMAGMPMVMPAMTSNQCVTPAMLESSEDIFREGPLGGPMQMNPGQTDCTMEEYDLSGRTVTWTMACTQPQAMTVTGEMTFDDETYAGTVRATTPAGLMTMSIDARRVGDCE